jgi:hypothetical protein
MWTKSQWPLAGREPMLAGMDLPPPSPAASSDDRRAVPRRLRDSEHEPAPDTAGSGMRRGDVLARRGGRGVLLLAIAAAAAAVLAALGFRRR